MAIEHMGIFKSYGQMNNWPVLQDDFTAPWLGWMLPLAVAFSGTNVKLS